MGENLAADGLRSCAVGYLEGQWVGVGMVLASCLREAASGMAEVPDYKSTLLTIAIDKWVGI